MSSILDVTVELQIFAGKIYTLLLIQPVLQCNRDCCNMPYPVCGMMHIKEPLLLIGKSSPCGGSKFPLSLSEWSFTICLMPYAKCVECIVKLNISFLLSTDTKTDIYFAYFVIKSFFPNTFDQIFHVIVFYIFLCIVSILCIHFCGKK